MKTFHLPKKSIWESDLGYHFFWHFIDFLIKTENWKVILLGRRVCKKWNFWLSDPKIYFKQLSSKPDVIDNLILIPNYDPDPKSFFCLMYCYMLKTKSLSNLERLKLELRNEKTLQHSTHYLGVYKDSQSSEYTKTFKKWIPILDEMKVLKPRFTSEQISNGIFDECFQYFHSTRRQIPGNPNVIITHEHTISLRKWWSIDSLMFLVSLFAIITIEKKFGKRQDIPQLETLKEYIRIFEKGVEQALKMLTQQNIYCDYRKNNFSISMYIDDE
jgi:hypothetical protein